MRPQGRKVDVVLPVLLNGEEVLIPLRESAEQ